MRDGGEGSSPGNAGFLVLLLHLTLSMEASALHAPVQVH
jgi:hypothetical protein